MASHGLFVAGIIRSIAPQAKLRLIQVLNQDGGGSVESITQGLTVADRSGRGNMPPALVSVQSTRAHSTAVPLAAAMPELPIERD